MSCLSVFRNFSKPSFVYENAVLNGEQEKESCEGRIEKSVPRDYLLSS